MFDIITIGSATRDAFFKSKEFHIDKSSHSRTGKEGCFILGTKIEVPDVVFTTGGGGINTAFGFARQGLRTGCIVRVGDDFTGKELASELKNEGVEPLFQIDKEHKTALSFILVAPDGERTILEYRGANDYLSEKDIDWQSLKSHWLFLDSLAGNERLLEDALNWAKENDVKVAMDPGKKLIKLGRGLQKYLATISIFKSNQEEAGFITEMDPENEKAVFKKMDELVEGIVVMTKGPEGVVVSDLPRRGKAGGKRLYQAGIPESGIIDRTGAGDAFSSGFIAGYIQSKGDISFAVQLGTANATSVVQYFGARQGLLKKGDWGKWEKAEVKISSQ